MKQSELIALEKNGFYPVESEKFSDCIYILDRAKENINVLTSNTGKIAINLKDVKRFVAELLEVSEQYREAIYSGFMSVYDETK